MFEDLRELSDSITGAQIPKLREALGDDLYALLDLALESDSESEAKGRVAKFVEEARKSPLRIIKARRFLDDNQKEIVMKFLDP